MHAPADETPDFDLLAELLVIHDRNGRCRERDLLAALPHLRAEDAHAALDRLVASGQAESVAGGLAPTSFGRELVERAHARGSTGARLLVGVLFATIETARAGRRPLADHVVIELEVEQNVGTIDGSMDAARARGWVTAPGRLGFLRTPVGEVWELAEPATAFDRQREVERITIRCRSLGIEST